MKIVAGNPFFRVICGGCQTDFPIDEKKKVLEFLSEQLEIWAYASMRIMWVFQKIEE